MIRRTIDFLKLIYRIWMRFAAILAWINTRLILIVMFYLVFMPIGLIMRIFGMDTLGLKIEKNKESYWLKKDKKTNYERQF